jgi:hypothetical protein
MFRACAELAARLEFDYVVILSQGCFGKSAYAFLRRLKQGEYGDSVSRVGSDAGLAINGKILPAGQCTVVLYLLLQALSAMKRLFIAHSRQKCHKSLMPEADKDIGRSKFRLNTVRYPF